jgi:hypothetical protein
MFPRLKALVIGLCLLIPCLLVVREAGKTRELRADVAGLQEAAEKAPAGFDVLRQVTDLRTQLRLMESDLVRERLRHLPQDATQWHTSLIVQPDWKDRPAEARAKRVLESEPHLAALKAQTKFHLLTTDDAIYRRDFSRECPLTPCLLITRANGDVIYKESGAQLGRDPRKLYCAVQAEWKRHCPDGKCIPPLRFPDQKPDEAPLHEQIPDTHQDPPAESEDLLPMFGCFAIGAGIVFYVVIKKDLAA